MNATIARAGLLTTVQDLGRTGLRQFGVSLGGALDAHALRVANLLVGNNESDAALEITFGRLQLRFADERIVAWGGGEFDVCIGSTPLPEGHSVFIEQGEKLEIDRPKTGCRLWLAISGGIDVPLALGSRSTDLRANFGGFNGRPFCDGEELPLGTNSERAKILISKLRGEKIARWKPPHEWSSPARAEPVLRVARGADWDRFNSSTHFALTSDPFSVSPDSDRMGVRFEGPELQRSRTADLVSEPVAPGTVQVPPSGQPILLLGDCQTIGGYPKIAHMITVDFPAAAQLRAGDCVRFREVSLADAHRLLIERERNLEQFRRGLQGHFS
jgi:antagonist of KipI